MNDDVKTSDTPGPGLSEGDIQSALEGATPEEIAFFKKMLQERNVTTLNRLHESLYRVKPPTPMEFLDHWVDPKIKKGLFKPVIDIFCSIWDFNNRKSELVLYGGTRNGKSTLSRLSIIYIVVLLWCMKEPQEYLGINKMSSIAIFLLCFSKRKTRDILLKPLHTLLLSSPKFFKVDKIEKIRSEQERLGNEKIVWGTASVSEAEIEFSGNIEIHLGSNPMDIIGADIVAAIISEINFFIETVGVSEDDVWKVYTETKDRILGTVGKKYGSLIILDSSANNRDSLIETYILEEASKDKDVLFINLPRWDVRPELFPRWQQTKETFSVFTGSSGRAASIVDESFKKYPGDDEFIIQVPIDAFSAFKKNLIGALRNIAGVPTGSTSLFFPDPDAIDALFDPYLENVSAPIGAPLHEQSKGLVMRQVRNFMFDQDIRGRWFLRRAKNSPRWVRIDLSESSDRTGVTVMHAEIRNDGTIMLVADLSFDIRPDRTGINLDAVLSFIQELYKDMNVKVAGVSTDRYQSSFIKQAMAKDDIPYKLISVDTSKTPYQVFRSKVMTGTVKTGFYRNIRNNMKSLIETKNKIDHAVNPKARTKGREEDKEIGMFAKDIVDSLAGAAYHLSQDLPNISVVDNYDDLNRIVAMRREVRSGGTVSSGDRRESFNSLMHNIQRDLNPLLRK